ncbi:PDCD5-related protein [Carpediemonas membranifera]|uniref:PDCD5-related protein n=1 Tax=Carpediemonas membranifera TaxID=201153 RepID=A0A8J6E4B2_9EUKA|nr:PDCD5-related protein [Carpediemonas membranifera]|eukprot:KAG9396701.1 PDCD5-related protein [Carpediemonas membranifera]
MDGIPPEAAQKMAENAEKQAMEAEQRRSMLAAILTPEARNRLGNITAVNPEKAEKIEKVLVQAAQAGKIRNRIDEDQLKSMLNDLTSGDGVATSEVIFHQKTKADMISSKQAESDSESDTDSDSDSDDPDFGTRTKITIRMGH